MARQVEGLVQGAHLLGGDTVVPLKMEVMVGAILGQETATVGPRPPEEETDIQVDQVS